MKRYYSVLRPHWGEGGVAYDLNDSDMFLLSENVSMAGQKWRAVDFELRDGDFDDYQASDLGWNICSEQLKNIIDRYAAFEDKIEWLPVRIRAATGRRMNYNVLHIPFRDDVLHKEGTIYTDLGHVIRPCIDMQKVGGHQIFSYPGGLGHLFVSHELKTAIEEAGCTGISFMELNVR